MLAEKRRVVAEKLSLIALWVFTAVFLCVFIQIFLFNTMFTFRRVLQLVLLAAWLVLVVVLFCVLRRRRAFLYKHKYFLLGAVLVFVFTVQFWVGVVTKQTVDHDYGKIFNGAAIYVTQGNSPAFEEYLAYYHHFTNNVGGFLFLKIVFQIVYALGSTNFYGVAVVIGHFLFTVAILFTFLYIDKAFGTGPALLSLLFWMCFLPVYFQSSIMYTDTLTVWMPPVLLYCHQGGKTAKTLKKRILCYAALGLVLALGGSIKGTVLITGVAILIEMLLHLPLKRLLAGVLAVAVVYAGVTAGINAYTYNNFLDKDRVWNESMPVTFWLMMGLEGDGAYNAYDEWTITVPAGDKQAKIEVNKQVIRQRLQEMGPGGYLQLLHRKTCRSFGSGNGEVNYLLVRGPQNPGHWVYSFIAQDGKNFRIFNNLSQAVYLSFYLLGALGVLLALRKKQKAFLLNAAPFISLIGYYLFMLLWEANHRQLVNQWPLFIITAAAGGVLCLQFICEKAKPALAKIRKKTSPAAR